MQLRRRLRTSLGLPRGAAAKLTDRQVPQSCPVGDPLSAGLRYFRIGLSSRVPRSGLEFAKTPEQSASPNARLGGAVCARGHPPRSGRGQERAWRFRETTTSPRSSPSSKFLAVAVTSTNTTKAP